MTQSDLYDDDILLWSEKQAEIVRNLGRTRRDLPNEFDVENVAEEIESVGRSELAAVESQIRLIFLHLLKLFADPTSDAIKHWRSEALAFGFEARSRYAPSMRQRLNLDKVWSSAREQMLIDSEGPRHARLGSVSVRCPFVLDDLLDEHFDIAGLVQRIQPPANGG